ncbi:MAG: hypothetical protein IJR11_03040, partial [Synergistaceae bacterium]|nr:hypothetical protein [Synergistaceae bacterium]
MLFTAGLMFWLSRLVRTVRFSWGSGVMMTGLKRTVRIIAPVMLLLLLILHGVSSGAVLNPPRAPELSGTIPLPSLTLGVGQADSPRDVALTLQILALMTILSLVPA